MIDGSGRSSSRARGDIVRVHRFLSRTTVEGPGVRACIWVQGCSIGCPGCAVPWTWPRTGGTAVPVDDLFRQVIECDGIEGVTFVGGEPFEQAHALANLGQRLRDEGLSIVTFTGLTLEKIREAKNFDWDALVAITDLLIDGPFVAALADQSRPWVGSSNQTFHFLTPRYLYLRESLKQIRTTLEVHISPSGVVKVNGMMPDSALAGLFGKNRFIV